MRETSRTARAAQLGALALTAAAMAACSSTPLNQPVSSYPSNYPTATYPTQGYPQPVGAQAPSGALFGRVNSIEFVPPGTAPAGGSSPNVLGAVVGGVAGAVLGRQVGGGSGRDAATVIGGLGGAAVGSQVGRNNAPAPVASGGGYRVTVVTDQGAPRVYEVAATGDLRVGDRVRIDNGVIYRM